MMEDEIYNEVTGKKKKILDVLNKVNLSDREMDDIFLNVEEDDYFQEANKVTIK